jgi:hypothetical protein
MQLLRIRWAHFPVPIHLQPRNSVQMAGLLRWTRNKLNPAPRRSFANQPKALSSGRPVEEETLPDYDPEEFYPVHIGDVFKGKYQVLGKLGFGANSTVWLCRNTEYGSVDLATFYCEALTDSAS